MVNAPRRSIVSIDSHDHLIAADEASLVDRHGHYLRSVSPSTRFGRQAHINQLDHVASVLLGVGSLFSAVVRQNDAADICIAIGEWGDDAIPKFRGECGRVLVTVQGLPCRAKVGQSRTIGGVDVRSFNQLGEAIESFRNGFPVESVQRQGAIGGSCGPLDGTAQVLEFRDRFESECLAPLFDAIVICVGGPLDELNLAIAKDLIQFRRQGFGDRFASRLVDLAERPGVDHRRRGGSLGGVVFGSCPIPGWLDRNRGRDGRALVNHGDQNDWQVPITGRNLQLLQRDVRTSDREVLQ